MGYPLTIGARTRGRKLIENDQHVNRVALLFIPLLCPNVTLIITVNSILDGNDELAAIFKANLTFESQSLFIAFIGAVHTIFSEIY